MARKIKFALEMAGGVKVRSNLEELREHFDLEKAVGYFLSGKLVEWLEDRYYDAEAEQIKSIGKEASDLKQKLCAALGVAYDAEQDVDVEQIERLNEKKAILRQKTDDENIIAHAGQTAFTQEDLAELLDMDEETIYLCGDSFTIPVRVANRKYIGILGKPKITVSVQSEEELAAKGIVCENLSLPWTKETPAEAIQEPVPPPRVETTAKKETAPASLQPTSSFAEDTAIEEDDSIVDTLREIFNSANSGKETWEIVSIHNYSTSATLNDAKKKVALRLICKNRYKEEELVHIKVSDDLSRGWALTKDSVCFGGKFGNLIVKYEDIDTNDGEPLFSESKFKSTFSFDEVYTFKIRTKRGVYALCNGADKDAVEILIDDSYTLNTFLGSAVSLF